MVNSPRMIDEGPPARITICFQDAESDYNPGRGRYVGTTRDGRRFWITTPFQPAASHDEFAGRDFVALYLWNQEGAFLSATFEQVAVRSEGSALPGNTLGEEAYAAGIARMLERVGEVAYHDIEVTPFAFELNGVEFGLIPTRDDDDDEWCVLAMPGDYMCFNPPWDGEYDT
jgi:hypothetical protein